MMVATDPQGAVCIFTSLQKKPCVSPAFRIPKTENPMTESPHGATS